MIDFKCQHIVMFSFFFFNYCQVLDDALHQQQEILAYFEKKKNKKNKLVSYFKATQELSS